MFAFIVTFLFSGGVYLLLTAGSGSVLGFWAPQELWVGLVISLAAALMARNYFFRTRRRPLDYLRRWVRAVAYVFGPFFAELTKANLDVAYRVLTGRMRPGIVRVKTGMKTDAATLLMANSITLTPGTLTVDIDEETNDLFIHMIDVPEGMENRDSIEVEELFSLFNCPSWVRRIAE